ncbi:hypothetical protein EXD91_06800 [Acinetobacter pittii]|uniref:hypothetical protein n=1 Tax=Acinetobacter pittii TaxID=48296 RepID=UPI000C15EDEB|nr:hypothetical protein [Acinetobacter pittii]AZB96015.1 hypothetical protein DKE42_001380 [Acinetobacter pittii]MRA19934.1 hypothetical protein [Acinetobacter pittii]PSD74534.1 hypothetical protein C7G49_12285 [Acinetobacter pittii]RSN93305.1 hypothetical protein EA766_02075 [Acinetobacter pittii]RSO00172.1 hypothetical protein EA765_05300 [Acinetobacter pittii]
MKLELLKLKNSYYLAQTTFEKIYKYQTKEISLNKTSLRASQLVLPRNFYFVKSPRKSAQIREGATVTTSNAIANG